MSNKPTIHIEEVRRLGIKDKERYYQISIEDDFDSETIFLDWGDAGKKKADDLLKKGPKAIVKYVMHNEGRGDELISDASNNESGISVGDDYIEPEDLTEIVRKR